MTPVTQSSPASAKTGLVPCKSCSHENESGRKFCGSCGESLWQVCPACGKKSEAAESFCGHCGADVAATLQERRARLSEKLAEAYELHAAADLQAALSKLRSVAQEKDDRHRDLAEEAQRRIETIQLEQKTLANEARAAVAAAEQHLEHRRRQEALQILEAIPESARTVDASRLIEQTRYQIGEQADLEAQLRVCVQAGRLTEIAEITGRLLELNPDHAQANRLLAQLKEKIISRAKKKFAEHKYTESIDLAGCLLASQQTEETKRLMDVAKELEWLQNDLKTAAVADETLAAVAKRLLEKVPENPLANRLNDKLQKRLRSGPTQGRCRAIDWVKAKESPFDVPVDWWTHTERIPLHDSAQKIWDQNPGRLFVACGLAIQSLGRADVNMSFSEDSASGVLGRFGLRRKKANSSAWGLDAGLTSLKVVRLILDASDQVAIEQAKVYSYEKDLATVADEFEQRDIMRHALEQFRDECRPGEDPIGVAIPASRILGRFFDIPPAAGKRREEAIAFEAKRQIPFPLDELTWKQHSRPLMSDQADASPLRISVQAAKPFLLEQWTSMCQEAGLSNCVLQGATMALHNFVAFELFDKDAKSNEAIAVVDVGAGSTNVVISSPDSVWFRNFGVGGNSFTAALLKPFRLTRDKAERLKQRPTAAKRISRVYDEFEPAFDKFVAEVRRSLDSYEKDFPDIPVQRIYCVGGGVKLHGLLARLRGNGGA